MNKKEKFIKKITSLVIAFALIFGVSEVIPSVDACAATKWYKMSSYGIKNAQQYNIFSISGNNFIYRRSDSVPPYKAGEWKTAKITGSTVYLKLSTSSPYIDWSDDTIHEHIQNVRICKKSNKNALKKHIKKNGYEYPWYGISFRNGKVRAISYNYESMPG